jgi:hypothetical protein
MSAQAEPRLTIGELAAAAGMTVRNVRNHAARGLLAPPELVGRTGFYGTVHLEQLALIRALQDEGFNLDAIASLLCGAPGAPPIPPADVAQRCGVSPAAARHAAPAMGRLAELFDRALAK